LISVITFRKEHPRGLRPWPSSLGHGPGGNETSSPVANDYFDLGPFEFEGTLKRLYFKNLPAEKRAVPFVRYD
jgi:hypothetical protein